MLLVARLPARGHYSRRSVIHHHYNIHCRGVSIYNFPSFSKLQFQTHAGSTVTVQRADEYGKLELTTPENIMTKFGFVRRPKVEKTRRDAIDHSWHTPTVHYYLPTRGAG